MKLYQLVEISEMVILTVSIGTNWFILYQTVYFLEFGTSEARKGKRNESRKWLMPGIAAATSSSVEIKRCINVAGMQCGA